MVTQFQAQHVALSHLVMRPGGCRKLTVTFLGLSGFCVVAHSQIVGGAISGEGGLQWCLRKWFVSIGIHMNTTAQWSRSRRIFLHYSEMVNAIHFHCQ